MHCFLQQRPLRRRPFWLFAVSLITLLCFTLAPAAEAKKKKKKKEQVEEKKEDEKWQVTSPPGAEFYDVEIDVEEGTWVNLDVSPDGEHILFDLLGDLYEIPFAGGEAAAIRSGLAWDMQPRYSPDGTRIAFTSDEGGGDNIWVMNRDGSDAEAVSNEDFRLLNDPVWSPDGEWIAARKHFTSRRSLGAGEIWLYHHSGGKGLQLNERPNDQKDLGEPAFSPDGRYVFFSRDSTPGSTFQYNKNSNTQIYTIHRLDRNTGDIETFISGPGGAITPTPSPDGKWMAFVRRVQFQSTLFLHDMETGRNTPIFSGMERDMQEAWAIHGPYTNMAWTPDSKQIVFWAGGKIHRIDVQSREVVEIPFHVKATHQMQEALHFRQEAAPETFRPKMLRWTTTSPDGDQVVFQALGHLWIRALPDGEPRRLTSQNDHFEHYPSFSRDGKSIVYVTWDDQDLGQVRVVSAAGGEGKAITSKPGHYAEPTFSPDGAAVVYRKFSGGWVTSPLYGRDTGLYKVSASGGDEVRITSGGSQPHFGADSDRVFFTQWNGYEDRVLRSASLTATSSMEREVYDHAGSSAATEMRVSPDGKWIAFREGFEAYVAPFTSAAKKISLSPKMSAIPVREVSNDAGEYLHWSGDSQSLYWSLGSELFRRDVKDAFAWMPDAPEELPKEAEGIDLSWDVKSDVPSGAVAFTGARLITMNGDEVIENGVIVVEGDEIVAVGDADTAIPDGAHVVDASGKTILPGLVDVHWHGSQGTNEIVPQRNYYHDATLAFGVTTIHDPSTDTSTFFAAAEMARAGLLTAPRLYSTGTILYGAAGDFKAVVNSFEDAQRHLRRMKAVGAFSVKSYNQPRRDQRQQIIKAAQELEMLVVPEGGSTFMHNMTMLLDGHTGIEHNIPVSVIYDDVKQFWNQSRTAYTPTLVVSYGGLSGENYWYQHTNVWENERLTTFVPQDRIDARSRRRPMAPEEEYNHISDAGVCKVLTDQGVKVNLGAHGQREGLGSHWELWMFAQGGMTEMEVLRAGTQNGADYIGMGDQLGSLEVGKLADLIVLEKNPLENIRNTESVLYTMVGGRLYDAATMNEIGNHPREREPLFFQE